MDTKREHEDDKSITGSSVIDNPDEGGEAQLTAKPSQAEGDRETIEESIEEKEASGEL